MAPTHDADKTGKTAPERRTMTRDPNNTGGPIVESGETDENGNAVTTAGSVYLTANIDGKWYVTNSRGEKLLVEPFDTESEATAEAQRRNDARQGVNVEQVDFDRAETPDLPAVGDEGGDDTQAGGAKDDGVTAKATKSK